MPKSEKGVKDDFVSASSFGNSVPDYFDGEKATLTSSSSDSQDSVVKMQETTKREVTEIIKKAKLRAHNDLQNYMSS